VDPRSLLKTPEGVGRAWSLVEEAWAATEVRARRLPEARLHESVNGEWSFVETERHLVFVTDAWVRRTILGLRSPYHRWGMPPDHRIGQPDGEVDVAPWGIDVFATAPLDEVLALRAERRSEVRQVVDGLTPDALLRPCPHNPEPGFPPMTAIPVSVCLDVLVSEEWAHHQFAVRDLDLLEAT
jgi:hypothetical protein